jgi:hypothetical protein
MHATVGERRRHVGQVPAIDQDRALAKIIFQRCHRFAVDDAEILQHPGDGAIAEAGRALRTVHRFVDADVSPHEGCDGAFDPAPLRLGCRAGDQTGGGDCTSIDHRIERCTSLGIEADGIEGIAARFHAHLAADEFGPVVRQGSGIDEGLGDGLDGKELVRVAYGLGCSLPIRPRAGRRVVYAHLLGMSGPGIA